MKTETKEAAGPVISGGHLVAKALKNEGVEVLSTYATSRWRRMRPTVIRGKAARSAVS
jgi:hypothetical protein